jgi:S1-C subfamily serine protease
MDSSPLLCLQEMRPLSFARVLGAVAVAAVLAFAPRAAGAPLGAGVVDVTTNLAYQNGAAAGTGIVLTPSGEVLTNNHVIRGATTIRVTDPSTGHGYAATVVGYSITSDVAILRLKGAMHLQAAALGNSSSVKVGDRVTALGNAGGAGGKPDSAPGRVTGLGRSIVATDEEGRSERLVGLIRIDAALQPGDSGGPLVNAAGRVIGMDTAASVGFRFQSASEGYAIPIDRALAIAKQIEAGRTSATVHVGPTPFLGVSVASRGVDVETPGAYVVRVVSGSPADRAGIVAGDTITGLDGRAVASYDTLGALLLRHTPPATVALRWVDETGSTRTAKVRITAGPPQ